MDVRPRSSTRKKPPRSVSFDSYDTEKVFESDENNKKSEENSKDNQNSGKLPGAHHSVFAFLRKSKYKRLAHSIIETSLYFILSKLNFPESKAQ